MPEVNEVHLALLPPGHNNNYTHTHAHTHPALPYSIFSVHVCHSVPSGLAGQGKSSRAKFRKQLREMTTHQWTKFQYHFGNMSVSQLVSLVKSLTPQLEATKEENQQGCMLKSRHHLLHKLLQELLQRKTRAQPSVNQWWLIWFVV